MSTASLKILCRYQYDPLDRLMGVGVLERTGTQRFYQQDHLTTELGEQAQRTIFRHQTRPLAQQQNTDGVTATTLLATDQAHSPLQTLAETNPQQLAYTAYGHHPEESGLSRLLGFNGECPDSITGHYLLGQGTRAFNPVLMRFNSPDELSPFGEGGINCYAYCQGDPINFNDPTGNMRLKALPRKIVRILEGRIQKPRYAIEHAARPNLPTRNSSFNATDTSATVSAPQPRPSTSTLAPQEVLYPHQLPATKTNTPKLSTPKNQNYQNLLKDAEKYDNYIKQNKDYKPVTSGDLLEKATKYTEKANPPKNTTPQVTIHKAKQSLRRTEMKVKQYNIRKMEGNNPS